MSLPTAILVSAALAISILSSSPALAQYPQDAATAGVSDTTIESGQPVTVGGEGWRPGSSVILRAPSGDLGEAPVDERGAFTTEVTLPADASGEEQLIRVSGTSLGGEPSEIRIRMLVGGAPEASEVDYTVGGIAVWVLIALALFGLGAGAVIRGRSRSA